MHKNYFEVLWEERFKRIRDLEISAFYFYSDLLDKYRIIFRNTEAKLILEQMMKDEARHARIADQLLRLVKSRAKEEVLKVRKG